MKEQIKILLSSGLENVNQALDLLDNLLVSEEDLSEYLSFYSPNNTTVDALRQSIAAFNPALDAYITIGLLGKMAEIQLQWVLKLSEINLSNCKIEKLPDSFEYLSHIETLCLNCTGLKQVPIALKDFKNLQRLELNDNEIEKLPFSLSQWKKLQVWKMESNKLSEWPTGIHALEKLRILNVSYNSLSEIPDEIGNLKLLEEFYCLDNPLHTLPSSLGTLSKLKKLHLEEKHRWHLHRQYGGGKIQNASSKFSSLPRSFDALFSDVHLEDGEWVHNIDIQLNLQASIWLCCLRAFLASPRAHEKHTLDLPMLDNLELPSNLSDYPNLSFRMYGPEILQLQSHKHIFQKITLNLVSQPFPSSQFRTLYPPREYCDENAHRYLNWNFSEMPCPQQSILRLLPQAASSLQALHLEGVHSKHDTPELHALFVLRENIPLYSEINKEALSDLFSIHVTANTQEGSAVIACAQLDALFRYAGRNPNFANRITKINLVRFGLRELPKGIEYFQNLEELRLNYNQLERLPSLISFLPKLRILDLEGNALHDLPFTMNNLKSLTHLYLQRNPNLYCIPNTLTQCPKLRVYHESLVSNPSISALSQNQDKDFILKKEPFRPTRHVVQHLLSDAEHTLRQAVAELKQPENKQSGVRGRKKLLALSKTLKFLRLYLIRRH